MWHEARRQEKKIRGLMVDLKRRADRRREFYEKIKQDPTQFLRMYGRPVKIHLDPAVAKAAEGPQSMMSWQGDSENMIDRFDVRANLDFISEYHPNKSTSSKKIDEQEERLASYERYRTLVENEASGLSEEQCLHQIYLDEHFGTINKTNEEEKKKNADKKAAIGYVYEDSTPAETKESNENSEEESDEDLDMADLDVTIDVDTLTPDLCREVNLIAGQYGMIDDDFVRLLRKDKEELEALKEARQLEEAKAQFSGRKSRRERRAINEKRQNPQRFCRPSYAARDSPKYEPYKRPGSSSRSRSRSRSRSSEKVEVKFITSFGNDSDDEGRIIQGPSLPTRTTGKKKISESSKCETPWLSKSNSKSESKRSGSSSRSFKKRQSSRSSSRSRSRSRSRSESRSRSYTRRRRSPRRSRGRSDSRRRSSSSSSSRSRSRSRTPSARHDSKRSRSKSTEKLPVKRYRRESLSSNSGLSGLDSDDDKSSQSSAPRSKPSDQTKDSLTVGGKLINKSIIQGVKETPQERLKRRMQAQINKQFRADKKAEISKISKQEQERMDREEEIKNLAIEMRRRERERRHKEREEEESDRKGRKSRRHGSSSSGSRSSSSSKSSKSSSRSSSPSGKSPSPPPRKSSLDRTNESRDRRQMSGGERDKRRDGRGGGEGRRLDGRSRTDGGDRRRLDSDGWESRRDGGGGGRYYDSRGPDSNAGYSDRMSSTSRNHPPDRRGEDLWDGERRWDGGRDDRRGGGGWRDRDDRSDRNDRSYGGSRWQSRPDPPSSQGRRRPLLHRPDSPHSMSRARYHPRD